MFHLSDHHLTFLFTHLLNFPEKVNITVRLETWTKKTVSDVWKNDPNALHFSLILLLCCFAEATLQLRLNLIS